MDEVATGPELAVFVLVVVAAHLLSENWLVADQFLHSVGEEAVVPVCAVPHIGVTLAELQLPLLRDMGSSFIIHQIHTHLQ